MWSIRPTIATDVPAILTLVGSIYAEYDCVFRPEEDDPFLFDPGPYFRTTGGEFWVVVADPGSGEAGVDDWPPVLATGAVKLHPDGGELKTLYVHPATRRRGIARRLTELAMEHARRAGAGRFFLWTDTRFVDAHRLYRAMGFIQFGERNLGDSNNSREYGFELRLTGEL